MQNLFAFLSWDWAFSEFYEEDPPRGELLFSSDMQFICGVVQPEDPYDWQPPAEVSSWLARRLRSIGGEGCSLIQLSVVVEHPPSWGDEKLVEDEGTCYSCSAQYCEKTGEDPIKGAATFE